jgi:hypothetical protein
MKNDAERWNDQDSKRKIQGRNVLAGEVVAQKGEWVGIASTSYISMWISEMCNSELADDDEALLESIEIDRTECGPFAYHGAGQCLERVLLLFEQGERDY